MTFNVDSAIVEVGGCGRYQLIYAAILVFPAIFPGAFIHYSHIFVSATPDHWCAVPELIERGVPLHIRKNLSIPVVVRDGIQRYAQCEMYNVNYSTIFYQSGDSLPFKDPTWQLQKCQYGWEYDHTYYDSTLVTQFDMVCDNKWRPSVAVSLFYVGSLLGSVLFGWMCDNYGRRKALFITLIFAVLLPFTSAFSPSYLFYTVMRFFIGFTYPAIYITPFILVTEFTISKYRTAFGMCFTTFWGLALGTLGLIAFLARNWFSLILVTSAPFAALLVYWWIIPESPRWLVSKNKIDEAESLLQHVALVNRKLIQPNILHRHKVTDVEMEIRTVHPNKLISSPNMRRKTILVSVIWWINSMAYVSLSYMSVNLNINHFLAFSICGLVEAPSSLLAWIAMEKLGRRWAIFITMMLVGLSCAGNIFVPEDYVVLNILLPTLGKFGITASFGILYIFTGELMPTVVRGNGLAVCSLLATAGLIGSPYIIYLVVYRRVLPFLIIGLLSFMAGFLALFLPETLGKTLPQTIEEGEEFGKNLVTFPLTKMMSVIYSNLCLAYQTFIIVIGYERK